MKKHTPQKPLLILIIITIFLSQFIFCGYFLSSKFNIENIKIDILSFNTLMAFPERALSKNNKFSNTFDREKITIFEFKKILESLYKNNYILVNIFDVFSIENKSIKVVENTLPKNKKPIILSFENVTYKSSYQNHGEIDKIIIDRNNKIATYTTKKSIQDRIQYDNEFLVILEDFVSSHPDFSFNNAKGIIFSSGENGLLGYNTNHKNISSKYETERVSEIIQILKEDGWNFGCNNYKYISDKQKSMLEFKKELQLWQSEILPIIGKTPLYSFPKGEIDTDKMKELYDNNFQLLFYNNFENKIDNINNQLLISKIPINGESLRNNTATLSQYFDCKEIYDNRYRTVPFT